MKIDTDMESRVLLVAALRLYVHHCHSGYQAARSDEMRQIWRDERDAAERIMKTYLDD